MVRETQRLKGLQFNSFIFSFKYLSPLRRPFAVAEKLILRKFGNIPKCPLKKVQFGNFALSFSQRNSVQIEITTQCNLNAKTPVGRGSTFDIKFLSQKRVTVDLKQMTLFALNLGLA